MANTSLDPSQILYSAATLRSTSWNGMLIGNELDAYVNNSLDIGAIPPLPVTQRNNQWVTKNNRRLWICRHLKRLGKLSLVRVKIDNQFVPNSMLNTITIIGHIGGQWAFHGQNDSSLLEGLTVTGVLGILGFVLLRALFR